MKRAIELKSSVENGWDIVSNGEIIWNPCTKFANAESLIQSRSKGEKRNIETNLFEYSNVPLL